MVLTRSLYYSLRYCQQILETEIPEHVITAIKPHGPGLVTRMMMDYMVPGVISPILGLKGFGRWIAMNGLYIRSHWLRMPPLLLVKHLSIKFYRSFKDEP